MTKLTERFDDALAYARQLHAAQVRKSTDIPYFAHLMAVSALVIEHGGSEEQAIAGLLHDAAEDQGGADTLRAIEGRYGAAVAGIVADCTDAWTDPKPAWRARKEAYLAQLPGKKPASQLVSAADKLHNARAILSDHAVIGPEIWNRFSVKRDQTVWYYQSLADVFSASMPGALSSEFQRAVTAMAACE